MVWVPMRQVTFNFRYIYDDYHWKTHISANTYISYIPVNLELRILLILEGLLDTLTSSAILTQMDDFTRKSIINGTISTSQLSISHFSTVTYTLPLRIVFTYLSWYSCIFTQYGRHIQKCAPTKLWGGQI